MEGNEESEEKTCEERNKEFLHICLTSEWKRNNTVVKKSETAEPPLTKE